MYINTRTFTPNSGTEVFEKHVQKCFIVSLAWKCDETNSKLLFRKYFFEIFLVQSSKKCHQKNEQTICIVLLAWKCVETNSKLLLTF